MTTWNVGDWAVFDREIVQIKEIRDGGMMSVSDGSFETSGSLADRLRPLTLRNKSIIEWFDYHYRQLRGIDGQAGFNYPGIHRHFSDAARDAIDLEPGNDRAPFEKITEFMNEARELKRTIQGVRLFRRSHAVVD